MKGRDQALVLSWRSWHEREHSKIIARQRERDALEATQHQPEEYVLSCCKAGLCRKFLAP